MPVQRGSVSFSRFRLGGDPPKDVKRWLTGALRARAFEPIDPKGEEDRAAGFVELENERGTGFSAGAVFSGPWALFSWRVEKLRIPSAQLREQLTLWTTKFEAQHGRPPGRREKAEGKEAARRSLRSKLEPVAKTFDVSIALETGEVHLWASSRTVVEEIHEALESGLKVRLVPRVPAAFVRADALDRLEPTPELFGDAPAPARPEPARTPSPRPARQQVTDASR